ncbi:MAG: hypothetical protein L6R40_003498 [Gallowayella cf. fulva]|nr:MAG: hypothetical protein L6R40_003498 [Xanthomendoza cf. fulva]
MAIATQGYRASHLGPISDTFPVVMEDVLKDNLSVSVKDSRPSSARRWLDAQQHHSNNEQGSESQSFFDFEPQTDVASAFPSQYPSLPDNDLTSGWNAISRQVPSPPLSAASPPSPWPPFQYQQPPPVHNILTDIYPDTRIQHGQNTPPDDEFSDLFASVEQPSGGGKQESNGKRKQQPTSSDAKSHSPSKRSRKNGRSSNSSSGQGPSSVEDVRRSKFLERNRVAASKCRQKKKEWTQNLENRARELQKENHSLRAMIDSMREEMLFIKGEMLKHSTCDCEQIQGWMKSNPNSLATSPLIKAEQSPINSPPASRSGSIDTNGHEHSSPRHSKSPQLQNLENLLITQLVHDTSDEGIERTLQATG